MTSQCLHKLCISPRQNAVIISSVYLIREMATQKLHNGSRLTPSESRLLTHCHATKLGSSLTSARLTHWSKHTLNQREGKSNTASCKYSVTFSHVCISVFWIVILLKPPRPHSCSYFIHILRNITTISRVWYYTHFKIYYMSTLVFC
jgi:hypothetical protein